MDRRTERQVALSQPKSGTVVDAKMSLAVFLKTGRASKNLSIADVAKVTKIQTRILERLEMGKLDGLPAEVFVRGFIRSYAKCCGLDEAEALARYGAAMGQPTTVPVAAPAASAARALVESMSELAPVTASVMVVPSTSPRATGVNPVVSPAQPSILVEEMPALAVIPESSMQMSAVVSEDIAIDIDLDEQQVPERISAVDVAAASVETVSVETAPVDPSVDTASMDAAPAVETTGKKKRVRRAKGTQAPKSSKRKASGTPSSPSPVVIEVAPIVETLPVAVEAAPVAIEDVTKASVETAADELFGSSVDVSHDYNLADPSFAASEAFIAATSSRTDDTSVSSTESMSSIVDVAIDAMVTTDVAVTDASTEEPVVTQPWSPRMPIVSTSSAPWRRPALGIYGRTTTPPVPSMVIDDSDPDSAERELEERAMAKEPRTSFLPPILRDRAKNGNGQGTLTLAVIILLIAATLTLSYLMRRPSSSGDGVTQIDATSQRVG